MQASMSIRPWMKVALLGLLPAAALSGCMTAPKYEKPDAAPPAAFRFQQASEANSIADLPWWTVFDDKALQGLIGEALQNNLDLKVAISRIEQARALVGVAQSEGKPQLNYNAGAGAEQSLAPGRDSVATSKFATVGGVFQAAWELDVWGRIRHSTEAAQANLLAQEDVRRGVMLTLVSDIATGYFRLLELDRELAIAQESAVAYKQTFDLFRERFEAGRDSRLPADRAEALYGSANAHAAELKGLIAQQEDALSILAGGYPHAIVRGPSLTEIVPPKTPVGATTDLLQRRPDIAQAEHTMMSANAQIGVAVANFFPRIGLSALLGGFGVGVSGNWDGFGVWNAALSAAGPIYSGGRLESEYKNRQAFWDETVAQYKGTVLGAFRDTSDALALQQSAAERRTALEGQIQALRRSTVTSRTRFDEGRATYFEVLETQQQLYPAEYDLAQTRRDQLLAVVNLYKALGGGWNLTPEQWTAAR